MDGYGRNPRLLQDESFLYKLLEELPEEIGMTKICPPMVCRYTGAKAEDWGLSGFVLIAQSHIAIHTFVEHSYIHIDIFSCQPFDNAKITDKLCEMLQLSEMKAQVLKRGLEYVKGRRGNGEAC